MSEKYTIYQDNKTKVYVIIPKEDYAKDCAPTVYCHYEKQAELVCRLLNENEARKSLPRIYKNYKKLFLIILNKKLNCFKKGNVGRLKSSDYYSQEIIDIENSIKAIESLDAE